MCIRDRFAYLGERGAGNTAEMLFTADTVWYAPLNIHYSVGVDGISVAMLLLSAVIVFTGTFASWKMDFPGSYTHLDVYKRQTKYYVFALREIIV